MKSSAMNALQVVACLACAICALVPLVEKTRTYWGHYGVSLNDAPPRMHSVLGGSPADRDGLRVDDVVLTAGGSPPLDLSRLNAVLEGLKPGGSVVLRVRRGDKELDLTAHGVPPETAAIYFPNAALPVAGGVCVALGLLVVGTGPLRPAPVWRSVVVAFVGLGAAVVFFLALAVFGPFDALTLRDYWPRHGGSNYGLVMHSVGLASALLLAVLGAWELRSTLAGRAAPAVTGPQVS